MYRMLIVEDDPGIAGAVAELARSWELDAKIVEDFRAVMSEFAEYDPQLVLMDISLPFYSGYYWCEKIRRVSVVPVIFISSASDNMNIVMAMNMGADDFIAKPFDGTVLIAKIQAVLRRAYNFSSAASIMEHRGVILNTSDGTLMYDGHKIDLTKNEYRILQTLFECRGKIVSRERLMEALWKTDSFVDENTLTVNVGRLRRKLDAAGLENFITTKVGEGYII